MSWNSEMWYRPISQWTWWIHLLLYKHCRFWNLSAWHGYLAMPLRRRSRARWLQSNVNVHYIYTGDVIKHPRQCKLGGCFMFFNLTPPSAVRIFPFRYITPKRLKIFSLYLVGGCIRWQRCVAWKNWPDSILHFATREPKPETQKLWLRLW
jgi:hypothetical protein